MSGVRSDPVTVEVLEIVSEPIELAQVGMAVTGLGWRPGILHGQS